MCTHPLLAYSCTHTEPTNKLVACTPAYRNNTQCKYPTPKKIAQETMCTACTIRSESDRLSRSKAEILNRCERMGATEEDIRGVRATEWQMRMWDGRGFGGERYEREGRGPRREERGRRVDRRGGYEEDEEMGRLEYEEWWDRKLRGRY